MKTFVTIQNQTLSVCTVAELEVLHAAYSATEADLRASINGSAPRWVKDVAKAEIARRGLK